MHVVPVKLSMSVPDIEIKKAIMTNPHNLEYVLEAIYNPQAFGTIAV